MLTAFALCLAGLCVLMPGARHFIDEIALIAEAFGVPPVIVGRFFHSQYWVCAGHYCTGQPGKSESTIITREIPMLIVSVAALLVLGLDGPLNEMEPDALGRSDGLILLLLFAIFLYYTVVYSLASQFLRGRIVDPLVQEVTTEKAQAAERPRFTGVRALTMLLGLAGVSFGADWTVEGASSIARHLGMAEKPYWPDDCLDRHNPAGIDHMCDGYPERQRRYRDRECGWIESVQPACDRRLVSALAPINIPAGGHLDNGLYGDADSGTSSYCHPKRPHSDKKRGSLSVNGLPGIYHLSPGGAGLIR